MKTEQEQIEEMAEHLVNLGELLSLAYAEEVCRGFDKRNKDSYYIEICEKLYSKGYRKASDVIDEFVERLGKRFEKTETIVNCLHGRTNTEIDRIIKIVAAEMRQEVEK